MLQAICNFGGGKRAAAASSDVTMAWYRAQACFHLPRSHCNCAFVCCKLSQTAAWPECKNCYNQSKRSGNFTAASPFPSCAFSVVASCSLASGASQDKDQACKAHENIWYIPWKCSGASGGNNLLLHLQRAVLPLKHEIQLEFLKCLYLLLMLTT